MISVYRSSETLGEIKRKLRAARGSGITATNGREEPRSPAAGNFEPISWARS